MSNEIKNITENIMNKIREGEIKMKPKSYFIIGSTFSFIGLVSSIITSVFFISLTRFVIRSKGGIMAAYKTEQMISNFPLWAPFFAVIFLFFGIRLMKRYDFSYKKNFVYIVIWLVLGVVFAGFIFDVTGLNEIWLRRGPMRGIMKEYFKDGGGDINLREISYNKNYKI